MYKYLLVVTALLGATPAWAEAKIEVPEKASWQHARSKVILPAKLAGMVRTDITDYSASEQDVAIQYKDGLVSGTIYLYRPYWNDVAIWFDRSEQSILANEKLGKATPLGSGATAFARPNGSVESGLYRLYSVSGSDYKISVLAIVPYDHWFLKIRYSTPDADTAAAETRLKDIIKQIKIPESASEGAPPQKILPCPAPAKFSKAKLVAPSMEGVIVDGATFVALWEKREQYLNFPDACRDASSTVDYTVYRDADSKDSYVMAAGDSGYSVEISKVTPLLRNGSEFWPMVSSEGQHILLPAFNKLPQPEQLFSVILSGQQRSVVNDDPDAPADQKQDSTIIVPTKG